MINSPLFWFLLNFASLFMLSFYSMMEMACVSFNKVRLQYYVSKGDTHALKLNYLLHNPSRLFGTTLIGVNIAMMFGSEFSRQFHATLGINPDWAPLTQVILVVILGELAPMFAARRYPESVAMLGIPVLYLSAKLMTPFLWVIQMITQLAQVLSGKKHTSDPNIYLSQEELQKILEETDEGGSISGTTSEFNVMVSNIFAFRSKTVSQVMVPIKEIPMIASNRTIGFFRQVLSESPYEILPVYHKKQTNIIGIAFPRDILREPDNRRLANFVRQPWFITINSSVITILHQFRHNKQLMAIVLDDKGEAVGILTLDDLVEEIFGPSSLSERKEEAAATFIDRSFPGTTKIDDFNRIYHTNLKKDQTSTLAELVEHTLGHHPEEGESIYIPPFDLSVKEATLREIKQIRVITRRQ